MRKHLKRFISLALVICMLATSFVVVSADTKAGNLPPEGSANIMIDGEYLKFVDAIPENVSGRIMIPYRVIFEYFGATVGFDEETRIISGEKDGMVLSMKAGDKNINYTAPDGTKSVIKMDVAPYIKNGRTFVPVRFISSTMGYSVGWDSDMRTVIVIDKDKLYDGMEKDFSLMLGISDLNPDLSKTYEVTGDMDLCMHAGTEKIDAVLNTSGLSKGNKSLLDFDMELSAQGDNANISGKMRTDLNNSMIQLQIPGITPDGKWEDIRESSIGDLEGVLEMAMISSEDSVTLIREMLSVAEDDYTIDSYAQMVASYELAKKLLGDKAFVKNGNRYTATFDGEDFFSIGYDMEGTGLNGEVIITKDSVGKVKSFDMNTKMFLDDSSDMFELVMAVSTDGNSDKISVSLLRSGMEIKINTLNTRKVSNKTFVW